MLVLSSFPLSNACRTDLASENMTVLFSGFVFWLKVLEMCFSEVSIASASASKFERCAPHESNNSSMFYLEIVYVCVKTRGDSTWPGKTDQLKTLMKITERPTFHYHCIMQSK